MKRLFSSLRRLGLAWLIAAPIALAQTNPPTKTNDDANKPVNIEADRGSYDDLKQLAVFTGNVVLTRGSLVIRADRIEVRQSPEGFQFGSAFGSGDRLASFRQKRGEGTDETIEGQGERIDYDGQTDVVTLIQRAQLRRLQNGKVFDEISGHTITYNNRTDVYNVAGGSSAKDSGNPQGRVRATIAPRGASTDASPSKGASSRLPLRPANTLNPNESPAQR
ncbi:MAG TPA: lipopolysaccharide transport periplasmic protein LptA [Burkholderiaceae bacterium]|nr:lipopolysaccharide transport periplasmic protein LptA [Burkholderiaceae bacterium]